MIGPFFYINSEELGYKGWLSQITNEKDAEKYGDFLVSNVGHDFLFDFKFKNSGEEYFNYPRGRVVFNTLTQSHIIYIDQCLSDKIDSIVFSYRLKNYTVMFDEHYVCKNCIGDIGL